MVRVCHIGPCRTMQLEVIDMVQQKKREKSDYDRRLSDCYFSIDFDLCGSFLNANCLLKITFATIIIVILYSASRAKETPVQLRPLS